MINSFMFEEIIDVDIIDGVIDSTLELQCAEKSDRKIIMALLLYKSVFILIQEFRTPQFPS